MTLVARIRRLPSIALAALALAMLVAAAFGAAPAAAKQKESCARKIVNDWYGDGKVDKIYEVHCYREAIRSLPVDVRDYSNAEEDILRALAYAKKGLPDPGPAGGKGGSSGNGTPQGPTGHTGSTDTTETDGGDETVAAPGTDTSGTVVDPAAAHHPRWARVSPARGGWSRVRQPAGADPERRRPVGRVGADAGRRRPAVTDRSHFPDAGLMSEGDTGRPCGRERPFATSSSAASPSSPSASRLVDTPAARAAAAPPNCAQAVIDDWYGNSRVDRRYAPHCYRAAIASLTPDQKDYLHAEEDIFARTRIREGGEERPRRRRRAREKGECKDHAVTEAEQHRSRRATRRARSTTCLQPTPRAFPSHSFCSAAWRSRSLPQAASAWLRGAYAPRVATKQTDAPVRFESGAEGASDPV